MHRGRAGAENETFDLHRSAQGPQCLMGEVEDGGAKETEIDSRSLFGSSSKNMRSNRQRESQYALTKLGINGMRGMNQSQWRI